MNQSDFNKLASSIYEASSRVLQTKGSEYSTEGDRLENFKAAAVLQNCTPEQALAGMMAKHVVSVYDMVNTGDFYPDEVWDEKVIDNINYLILLRALVAERIGQ